MRLHDLIEGEQNGNTASSLLSAGYGDTGSTTVPVVSPIADYTGETGGSIRPFTLDDTYGYADGQADVEQLIDKPADGWTGPSLDAFTGVSYAGAPGRGIENDQLHQSAVTSTGPGWTVPSDEVGIGKPPGFEFSRFPHVEQHNPRREAYVDQGVMADGMPYFPPAGVQGQMVQNHQPTMPAYHAQALRNPGFNPAARFITAGSAIIEQAPAYALSQLLGTLGAPGWGIS